jgi:hypothetical protein
MIAFHRFLIGTAIVFCAVFAAWAFVSYRGSGATGHLALGVAFSVATFALAYYLKHLNRFLRR